jgi:hypothetical protein
VGTFAMRCFRRGNEKLVNVHGNIRTSRRPASRGSF